MKFTWKRWREEERQFRYIPSFMILKDEERGSPERGVEEKIIGKKTWCLSQV